jgi:predicted DNA-binding protein (MmcQ/YjbR family)
MFALADLEGGLSINLKCDPELAIELREKYPSVLPGYHMNKVIVNLFYTVTQVPGPQFTQF